jgi:NAD-dependent dihydropyrimidine dehydrogenase PreA subunit
MELPRLDETKCTGCIDCTRICPVDCLEMNGAFPWLPRPQACVACGICVEICPVRALELGAWEPA